VIVITPHRDTQKMTLCAQGSCVPNLVVAPVGERTRAATRPRPWRRRLTSNTRPEKVVGRFVLARKFALVCVQWSQLPIAARAASLRSSRRSRVWRVVTLRVIAGEGRIRGRQ